MPDKATIEILNRDGSSHRVNGEKFEAMRVAMLAVLPDGPPGLTVAETKAALLPRLDPVLFPGGEKAGWWIKAVQLDHEARGLIRRGEGSPVRLFKA
ncbi:MAG: hypothetical protein MUE83_12515 [Tabrizicola sp.]|jgi:hypothetical protein|nr:hypothetical protein [Tabrizicola sp.]